MRQKRDVQFKQIQERHINTYQCLKALVKRNPKPLHRPSSPAQTVHGPPQSVQLRESSVQCLCAFLSDLFLSFRYQMSWHGADARCPVEVHAEEKGPDSCTALSEPTWACSCKAGLARGWQEWVTAAAHTPVCTSTNSTQVLSQAFKVNKSYHPTRWTYISIGLCCHDKTNTLFKRLKVLEVKNKLKKVFLHF